MEMGDEEDLIVATAAVICITAVYLKYRRRVKRFWVNPYLRNRNPAGRYGDVWRIAIEHS